MNFTSHWLASLFSLLEIYRAAAEDPWAKFGPLFLQNFHSQYYRLCLWPVKMFPPENPNLPGDDNLTQI